MHYIQIGQGTYSSVYKARDLENDKIVALKKVRFVNMDPESVRFMAREIHILRRLDHPNVMKLEGIVASRLSCSLYLVFEYMEHDLAGLAARGIKFTEPQVTAPRTNISKLQNDCDMILEKSPIAFFVVIFFSKTTFGFCFEKVLDLMYFVPQFAVWCVRFFSPKTWKLFCPFFHLKLNCVAMNFVTLQLI